MRRADIDLRVLRAVATRALPGCDPASLERVPNGISTPVYRLRRGAHTLYIRLAETPEASLAPEALAHELMRKRGVRVPEVTYFEACNPELRRSVMVTTAIPGTPLALNDPGTSRQSILAAAGRDLAAVHSIEVSGFGWVRRDGPGLHGQWPGLHAFALENLDARLETVAGALTAGQIDDIRRAVDAWIPRHHHERAMLVHGDLDATHIFHHAGRYSGLIDFGEIRGADPFYDLGHLALREGEHVPYLLLPGILAGYGEIAPLPPDHIARIHLWTVLIGLRALAREIERGSASRDLLAGRVVGALRLLLQA